MDSKEIRAYKLEPTCDVQTDQCAPMIADCAYMLREIAAQLADMNYHLEQLVEPGKGIDVCVLDEQGNNIHTGEDE